MTVSAYPLLGWTLLLFSALCAIAAVTPAARVARAILAIAGTVLLAGLIVCAVVLLEAMPS